MDTDTRSDLQFLEEEIAPALTEVEIKTFSVRDGVTFRDYEIFFGEKVISVGATDLKTRRANKNATNYLKGQVERSRQIKKRPCQLCGKTDELYTRKDNLREVYFLLSQAVTMGRPRTPPSDIEALEEGIADMTAYLQEAVRLKEKDNLILDAPVDKLAVRSKFCTMMKEAGIHKIRDLVQRTADEISAVDGLGKAAMSEIRYALERHGFGFKEVKNG